MPCPYRNIGCHIEFFQKAEERRNWTKEQKQELKKENEKILEEYGYCLMDGHKQRVGNFKIEPPGLFRGRGDHPKQGKLKKRTMPEDVIINIGQYVKIQLCLLLNCCSVLSETHKFLLLWNQKSHYSTFYGKKMRKGVSIFYFRKLWPLFLIKSLNWLVRLKCFKLENSSGLVV